MSNPLLKPSDKMALLGAIDPDAYAANTYTTGWIKADLYEQYLALVSVGDLGSSATGNAKLEQATSSGGANAKDIANKAITQLTQAGTDDNKQALINLEAEDLDTANSFAWFRLSLTIGTATSDACGFVFGFEPKYGATQATTVDEVVG